LINSSQLWLFFKIGEASRTLDHLYDVKITGKIKKLKLIDGQDLTLEQAILKEETKLRGFVKNIPETF